MKRFLWLGFVSFLVALWSGCGDTYRPVIIPNPPAFPDPRASHTEVLLSNNNGSANEGAALLVDVSGDSEMATANLGYMPVHAMQQNASQVLVVNQATGPNMANSLVKVNLFGGRLSTITISMPTSSAPNFVAVAPNDTIAYVSLPGTSPASIAVVNTTSNFISSTITNGFQAGSNPVALAVTPNKAKLYAADNGRSTVIGYNTVDQSLRTNPPISLSSPPVWVLARSDNQRAYVLEQDGTLATLDTSSTAGPDSLIATLPTGSGVVSMLYDGNLNRIYVPTASGQLFIVDVSQSTPTLLATINLPAAGVAVTTLPDSSRVYVASNGPSQATTVGTISSVTGDGTTATYTFDPNSVVGAALQAGMSLTVTGGGDGFDGTFIVGAVSGTTFQSVNPNVGSSTASRTGTGTNFLPQVTVVSTSSNTVKTTINMPAVPAAGPLESAICSTTRFRFSMSAAGDSSRVYLASCDGQSIDLIQTSNDTFALNLLAPPSALPPVPPSTQPPPQNPVFLIAGP